MWRCGSGSRSTGCRGILTIYLYYSAADGGLGLTEATATSVVGAYGGLVYLSTVVGAVIMGIAFLLFLPFAGDEGNTTPLLMLALILLVFSVAELLLSPVGLSLSTKLAPRAFRTQMVALNFLSIALGTATAGALAARYSVDDEAAYFSLVGGGAVVFGLLLMVASPFIRKLMSGVR